MIFREVILKIPHKTFCDVRVCPALASWRILLWPFLHPLLVKALGASTLHFTLKEFKGAVFNVVPWEWESMDHPFGTGPNVMGCFIGFVTTLYHMRCKWIGESMGRGCASNTNVLLSHLRKNAKGTLQRIFITQKQKAPVSKFVRLEHQN